MILCNETGIKKSALLGVICCLVTLAGFAQQQKHTLHDLYLSRAEYMYHKVWKLYREEAYGLFSEYYPSKRDTSITY